MKDRYWIGGGNIAGILGVSPYKTPVQEYMAMIGHAALSDDEIRFFERRKSLEPFAVNLFEQETGMSVVKTNQRYTYPQHSFIRAEIDAETPDHKNIEIKTVHPMAARDWGDEGADNIPVYVTAQAQHGLMVTDRQLCIVLAMIGFDDFRVYRVERDEDLISALREIEVKFWREHVEKQVPPAPQSAEDVARLFPRDLGTAVEASTEALIAYNELKALRADSVALDMRIEDKRETIMRALGPAARLTMDGQELCTWRSQSARRFDQSAFKFAHPALFAQFVKTTESRVLRIK